MLSIFERIQRLRAGWPLIAAVLAVAVPGAAFGMPMVQGGDATDCLDQSTVAGAAFLASALEEADGNFWARQDTFSLADGCSSADVEALSIIAKTPFQIEGAPLTDIDTVNDALTLRSVLQGLWPDFHPSFGANFGMDSGANDPPEAPPEAMFTDIFVCINASDIDDCLDNGPILELTNIGGGFMIFTIDLDSIEEGIFLNNEFPNAFSLTTIVVSDQQGFDPDGDVLIPEMMVGWQFAELVPEPALVALLGPAFAMLALRRRRC